MAITLNNSTKSIEIGVSSGDVAQIQYEEGYPAHYLINSDGTNQKVITAIIMGQSELEHILNPSTFYNQITKPTISKANCIVVMQDSDEAAPTKHEVTQANIDNGLVSYAMGALAEMLGNENPEVLYVIGDCAVSGTGRFSLADDSEDGALGFDGFARYWSDFTSVVNLIEQDYGPIQNVVECWYASDSGYIKTFKDNFWPFYFGANPDGTTFTLGQTYTDGGFNYVVDNCLWDASAPASQKGRGVFAKAVTSWHILTPMPFNGSPVTGTEAEQFTQGFNNEEPTRQKMHELESETLAQAVRLKVGPSLHIADYDGKTHPLTDDPDGTILTAMPFFVPLCRANRQVIGEPEIQEVIGPTNGAYIDVKVSLPNGGTLTTLRKLRDLPMPSTPSPHQQEVTGFEVFRASGSKRTPIFNTTQTTYASSKRGTVTITDSGSGNPKTGTVRITPTVNFEFGDSISYLRGQANGMLLESRDVPNKLFLDMMIEHIPTYYDSTANYPFEGIAVKPKQSDIVTPVAAPTFTPRAVDFDGTAYLEVSQPINTTNNGVLSFWFKNNESSWQQLKMIYQAIKSGGTIKNQFRSSSSARMQFMLSDGNLQSIFAKSDNTGFDVNTWYHVLIGWDGTTAVFYVNNELVTTATLSNFNIETLSRFSIGASVTGASGMQCSIGHFWLNYQITLDLSLQSNRDRFALNGVPVDLGANGELVTGTAPDIYFDGNASNFNNKGTAGALTLSGTLTNSATPPRYGV